MRHPPSMLTGEKWRGAIGGRKLPAVNPCTEQILGETPAAEATYVAKASEHACAALPAWRAVHG